MERLEEITVLSQETSTVLGSWIDNEPYVTPKELEKILGYVAQLETIDTTDVPPTARAVEVINVLREDAIENTDIREDLLELAPHREGNFFRVPKIL